MELREFVPADYEDVLTLWKQCEGVGLSGADSSCAIKTFLERNPGCSFIAIEDGKIVGTVLGGHDGRRGFLYHLAVDLNHRRRGIGKLLAESSLTALQALGIQKCHILVFRSNESGLLFWEQTGWKERTDVELLSYTFDAVEAQNPC